MKDLCRRTRVGRGIGFHKPPGEGIHGANCRVSREKARELPGWRPRCKFMK